jgi:alkyldihydroxyacetonephosphate synthase
VRLYDAVETEDQFGPLGLAEGSCLALFVAEGTGPLVASTVTVIREAAAVAGADEIDGAAVAEHWFRHRFSTAGLCRTLGTPLGVADALEVAADWSRIGAVYDRMRTAMSAAAGAGGRVYGHASHVYPSGTNVYMIFHAAAAREEEVPDRYRAVLAAAMDACLAAGGTITHHHGVGSLKAPWMAQELGDVGLDVLQRVKDALDPAGVLNPGRLGLGR